MSAKLGVADFLASGSLTGDELAKRMGANSHALFRVMRFLTSLGIFTQDSSDKFGLTSISRHLRTDVPESLRDLIIMFGEEHYKAAGELLHVVLTGETAFNYVYGKPLFEYLAEHPEASKTFNAAMVQGLGRFGSPFETYDFTGRRLVVDVGGGHAHLLAYVLRSNPSLNGILYDLPQGATEAAAYLESQGVSSRSRIVTGSFFDSIPSGGDVYVMSRVLHDWPDEKARLILTNCRKVVSKDGVLLISEIVLPQGDALSMGQDLDMDLVMLFMLGGTERTEAEWRNLLQGSGFALRRIVKTSGPFDLIEAGPV